MPYKETVAARIVLGLVVLAMIAADYKILTESSAEGFGYLWGAAARIPGILTVWAICWFGWQAMALIVFLRSIRAGFLGRQRSQ